VTLGNYEHKFDRGDRAVWDELSATTKLDTLNEKIVGLWEQIRDLYSASEHTWNDAFDLSRRIYQIFAKIDSMTETVDRYVAERNRTPPPPPPPPPPRPVVRPHISVTKKDSSSFEVTGSDFLPNATVTIRVADDYGVQVLAPQTTADGAGKIDVTVAVDCIPGAMLHFSATDSRPDPKDITTGVVWSNYVQVTC
jgi:hypothetical protein